jgi:hypothetical protein
MVCCYIKKKNAKIIKARIERGETIKKQERVRGGAFWSLVFGRGEPNECGVKFHARISSSTVGLRKSPRNLQVSRDVERPVTIKTMVIEKFLSFREASASFQAERFFVRVWVIGLLVTSPANGRSDR